MLKAADHMDKVKRLRVAEADVAPLTPAYEVSQIFRGHCAPAGKYLDMT